MKELGFTKREIGFVERYLDNHKPDLTASLVRCAGEYIWVCRTIAEAIEQLRPGSWLNWPGLAKMRDR
jgi:hypothetical protein